MKKHRKTLAIFLSCYVLIISSFGSFASGGANHGYDWTVVDKASYIVSHIGDIVGYGYQFIVNDGSWEDVRTSIFDLAAHKAAEAQMSPEEWLVSNTSFAYKFDGDVVENADTVDSITLSQEFGDLIQTTINTYVAENPLGYKQAYIQSYKMLGTSYFSNYSVYQTVIQYMENLSKEQGYLFFIKVENTSSYGYPIHIIAVPTSLNWNLYGTVNSTGLFNGVQLGINWQGNPTLVDVYNYPSYTPKFEGIKFNYIRSDNGAQLNNRWVGNANAGTIQNTTSLSIGGNNIILSSSTTKESVYVFSNMNSYKAYNSGSPQPYYLGSDFGSHINTYNVNDFSSMSTYYNNVVDNSKSGMTAEEVQKLIDDILDRIGNGNGSGSGSGSGSDDTLDLSFLGKIGTVISKLITAIGDLITNVLDGIVNAFIGEDGNGGIIGTVKNILNSLIGLITTDFSDFITSIFSFLPEELNSVLIAGFTIAVFLGVLRLVRR